MENILQNMITATVTVSAPVETVWECWNNPEDIGQWNNTDEDWESLRVNNDVRDGGSFLYEMAKKDGSERFDFEGRYDKVIVHQLISYTLTDGRRSIINFSGTGPVTIAENFEPVADLSAQMQKDFCTNVLVAFKNYAENKTKNS